LPNPAGQLQGLKRLPDRSTTWAATLNPHAIHAFNQKELPQALEPGSKHPHTVHRAFQGPEQAEALREMLHRSPREFGTDTSLWTLEMAAEVAFEEGLIEKRVSGETIRATLARLLEVAQSQAMDHICRPPLPTKKGAATD